MPIFDSHARRANLLRKAAERSLTEQNGLEFLFGTGLMRDWWFFRDGAPPGKWFKEDYCLALCLLAAMAETGDLPKAQGAPR